MAREDTQFNSETGAKAAAARKNPGRKPKIYSVIKELGYCKDDILAAFSELSFYNEDDLREAMENTKLPMITRIIAKNMLKAYESGNLCEISSITEHITGKPQAKVEHTGPDGENLNSTFNFIFDKKTDK